MRAIIAPALVATTLAALPSIALAKKPADGCERIKPAQQLSTETHKAVETMIQAGVTGLGRGQAEVSTETDTTYDTALLEGDALAKSWYTYQLCVLKETGAITPTMHEELMRKAWGLEPTATATATAPSIAAVDAPTGGAAIAATSNMTFLPSEDVATVVLAQCPVKSKLGTPKPVGRITWKTNGNKRGNASTDVGGAVDVKPGRLSLEAAYRYVTVSSGAAREMVVEAGKVHYVAVDYTLKMGNVVGMDLRPVGPGEGEEILARCTKTQRY